MPVRISSLNEFSMRFRISATERGPPCNSVRTSPSVFSFSLISPALFASDEDYKLSACCRRSGKHHCALMSSEPESSSGPALRASKCGSFPTTKVVSLNRLVGVSPLSQRSFAAPIAHPTLRAQAQSLYRIPSNRARQKRGPPTLA